MRIEAKAATRQASVRPTWAKGNTENAPARKVLGLLVTSRPKSGRALLLLSVQFPTLGAFGHLFVLVHDLPGRETALSLEQRKLVRHVDKTHVYIR